MVQLMQDTVMFGADFYEDDADRSRMLVISVRIGENLI